MCRGSIDQITTITSVTTIDPLPKITCSAAVVTVRERERGLGKGLYESNKVQVTTTV